MRHPIALKTKSILMKQLSLFLFSILLSFNALSQKELRILGPCSVKDLEQQPYSVWYKTNYDSYNPNAEIVSQLKKIRSEKFTVKVIFGSWCGDSKREVPKMMKVLSAIGFPEKNIQMIGVSDSVDLYKQSPRHEEKGLNIYRVGTFIVYKNNKEIGRIVEYPVESIERDLLKILSEQPYTPNYKSYSKISTWLNEGLLSDINIDPRGLAQQIRNDVSRDADLNTCGYVLLRRKDIDEAITVFRMNVNLFPQSANCFDSLGEAYLAAGLKDKSKACYQRVLELDPQNANAKTQLEKLGE
jgi:tetratricopeptide (TPR) repeat protein